MQITSVVDGFLWIPYVIIEAIQGLAIFGLVLLAAVIAVLFVLYRRNTAALGAGGRCRGRGRGTVRPAGNGQRLN